MTSCAVMQPTYLPWYGYFSLLSQVDVFVILDDVQFARDTWQSKNRVMGSGNPITLKVPVVKQALGTVIKDIKIQYDKPWIDRHLSVLDTCYAVFPGSELILKCISRELNAQPELLVDLNTSILLELANILDIRTKIVRASELGCGDSRSDHVANICKALGVDHYVSPEGARDYLMQDDFEEKSGLKLSFHRFSNKAYDQGRNGDFVSHLSIIDVLCRLGVNGAKDYLAAGAPVLD